MLPDRPTELKPKKAKIGQPVKKFRLVARPKFMAGTLYDVWFYPDSREFRRMRVAITTDPKQWVGEMARQKLDSMVRERFAGRLVDADQASLRITSRPNERVVLRVDWTGDVVELEP